MANRHTDTEEFKRDPVGCAMSSGRPPYKIAKSLGASHGALAVWIKAAEATEAPGAGSIDDESAELTQTYRPGSTRRVKGPGL